MDALEILQAHNVKKTSPRIAIIKAMQSSTIPLSENEVKASIGQLYDRITFYRNVQTLIEAGVIHKIVIDNTNVKYALNDCTQGHNHGADHVHFHCNCCKNLVCMPDVKANNFNLPQGYETNQCDVVIKGVCCDCKNNQDLQ